MNEKLQRLGRRWPALGTALDTQQRFGEINGGFVASAITVSIFISVFPLLLVTIAVIGHLASGDADWTKRFVDALGLTGSARDTVSDAVSRASESRRAASVVGLLGLLWSGTGVGLALQRGVRAPWQEPARGMRDRLQALLWLIAAGLGFAVAVALTGALNWLPDQIPSIVGWLLAIIVGVAIGTGLFLWMFWGLSTRHIPARDLLPGALAAAVGFEVLKFVGTIYVPRLVANSSSLYGPLGIVFALLAWLAIFARLIVYSSTLNAVLFERHVGRRTVAIHVPDLPDLEILAANRGGLMVGPRDLKPGLDVPTPVPDGADVDATTDDHRSGVAEDRGASDADDEGHEDDGSSAPGPHDPPVPFATPGDRR